ncbi:type I polyketide synthase, partial [Streptosporangium sp. NPDC001559]|uniref:type I polyketide synthase n=1 Tax=Streptosporangium sp. NPDC001559 TaxID=3366187 RepID=UPI0036E97B8C
MAGNEPEKSTRRERHGGEAIAVIGLACRLPGAPNPADLWELLRSGHDATGEPSEGRLRADPGIAGPRGGFLDRVDLFDAGFFGVSPREAAAMDPQQRLVLELAWEALEDAGLPPATLAGTASGVFLGAMASDYATLVYRNGANAVTRHTLAGLTRGILANRVSYFLGLRGPSLTVDTAQSSALVAVHLACESLRSGESAVALAGGVNLNLVPESTVTADRFGGLSPDGRCFTFDARANGYARGEGGGLVVLKPLARALADGDEVHAVILGSAVNNDGATAALTVPDATAQEEVVRLALGRAGIEGSAVQVVELHGTGTRVGDPVEAAALGAALGAGRPAGQPLLVGSVKTNIGHLEGAAGIAGLLKAVLSIRNREVPPSLNFETPSPLIDFEALNLRVASGTAQPWPRPDAPLLAGVSSFGVGGVNCHVVLGEAPPGTREEVTSEPAAEAGAVPLVLSARTPAALRAQAARLAASPALDGDVPDVAFSLATTRTAFGHRAVFVGTEGGELRERLRAFGAGEPVRGSVRGTARELGGTVFVFPGQGGQWAGMSRRLAESSPVFAGHLRTVAEALERHVDWSLTDVLWQKPGAPSLERVDVVQPALFAVMVALARLWESFGVRPDAVIGHSQGELAAAAVTGALSLEDAAAIVVLRSQALAAISGRGGMASLPLPAERVRATLARWEGRLNIGAVNGPDMTVVSGDADALDELIAHYEAEDVPVRRVRIDYASHSAHAEAVRDRLLEFLPRYGARGTGVAFYSSVTGGPLDTATLDADYWYRNLRQTVEFDQAVRGALADGHTVFVEVSPHPILSTGLERILESAAPGSSDGVVTGTLRRGDGGLDRFLLALAHLYTHGAPVNWTAALRPGARRVPLPLYAFQRDRHWIDATESVPSPEAPPVTEPVARPSGHTRELLSLVVSATADVLGHEDPGAVEAGRTFRDLGLDSLGAVELRDSLSSATGLTIPTTVTYDHPTPLALARHLEATAGGRTTDVPSAEDDRRGQENEPIALVSMAGRWPGGADTPEALWELVLDGTDAISAFPANRGWDVDALHDPEGVRPGTSTTREGGFLHDADRFDAEFFGIGPREAAAMDPQQRLLLETAWETLERAGIVPETLRGSRTGVFVGLTPQDYGPRLHETGEGAEGYALTGTTASVASGRISYVLGLEGPAVTVDTACSSSLVALHLAVRSLRSGESDLALAGGVTVMSAPGMFTEFSRQGGLAPDGRCKAFSGNADGTGWAEGVGLLLVERLSDARRNGHRVLAVIRGTAINQDGASNGLTAPNGLAQQRVIRQALRDAALVSTDVDAVEAHGTGTTLGDPIEAQALIAVYGKDRPEDRPLWLGSLKSNIGHTQAAAGVSGVIKVVQALREGVLPRTLHADRPSEHVDWAGGGVRLLTENVPLPRNGRPRRVGVSSFGISGTNAHVIIEQAPETPSEPRDERQNAPVALPLSARSAAALTAQASRLADHLEAHAYLRPEDVAHSLATTRSVFEHRAAILGTTNADLIKRLRALTDSHGATGTPRVTFLFTGQGSQRTGMGRTLYDTYPAFAQTFDQVTALFDRHLPVPLKDVIFDPAHEELLNHTLYTQPALFTLHTALHHLLASWNIHPTAVAGHSIGGITAAHLAGVLTLEDAAHLVAVRARLMDALPPGAMAAINAPETDVLPLLQPDVTIAALNTPTSTVITGDEDAVQKLTDHFTHLGRKTRKLTVSHAFHSHHLDPILNDFHDAIATLTFNPPTLPVISDHTGQPLTHTDPTYWTDHLRHPVRFHDVLRRLHEGAEPGEGWDTFLEIGPDGTLSGMVQETLGAEGVTAIPVLRRNRPEDAAALAAVARLHVGGVDVDWAAALAGQPRTVDLPTYAFQRERLWIDAPRRAADPADLGLVSAGHPLLGAEVRLAGGGGTVHTGTLSTTTHPWLADHAVFGTVVVPGTALVELALHAADHAGHDGVEELVLHSPLVLAEGTAVDLQVITTASAETSGRRSVEIYSRPSRGTAGGTGEWTRHADGVLTAAGGAVRTPSAWPPPGARPLDVEDAYDRLAGAGLGYGPVFQGLRRAWRRGEELFAEVTLPDGARDDAAPYGVHPALLDAALHVAALEWLGDDPRLPFAWNGVRLHASGATTLRVRAVVSGSGSLALHAADATGAPVVSIDELRVRPVGRDRLRGAAHGDALFRVRWEALPPEARVDGEQRWAVLGGPFPAPAGVTVSSYADLASLAKDLETGTPPFSLVVLAVSSQDDPVAGAHDNAERVLTVLREWVERWDDGRLLVLTRGAVAAGEGEVVDLTAAPVWGLARSAQTEHPGRVLLADLDGNDASLAALPYAVATAVAVDEPQVAVRAGSLLVPRLGRVSADGGTGSWNPEGTVLITGGLGTLGATIARHLVTTHHIRHLILTGRRGPHTPGADHLHTELTTLGAHVTITATDTTD